MKIFSHAIHDTFDGRMLRSIFLISGGAIASWLAVYFFLGGKEAVLELPFIYAGIIGAIAPLTLLFIWNLVCAPYRIEREGRLVAQSEVNKLKRLPSGNHRRTIPAPMKAKLRGLLRSHMMGAENVWVLPFQNEECADLAQEFLNIFQDAGAKNPTIRTHPTTPPSPIWRDIYILYDPIFADDFIKQFSAILDEYGFKHTAYDCDPSNVTSPFVVTVNRPS